MIRSPNTCKYKRAQCIIPAGPRGPGPAAGGGRFTRPVKYLAAATHNPQTPLKYCQYLDIEGLKYQRLLLLHN